MAKKRKQKASAPGELSSASGLLRGLVEKGGKFPGHRVIKEIRKGEGNVRIKVYWGGQTRRTTQKEIAKLARDRGYDLASRRFEAADAPTRARMLGNSLRWQGKAKERWTKKFDAKIASVRNPQKKKRLTQQRAKLAGAKVRSPLIGGRPVSSYVRRYWD